MPKSPSREGQGFSCPHTRKTPKKPSGTTRRPGRPSLIYQLNDIGIGLTASAAVLSWASRFGIETDWSTNQLALHAKKCDRKTISNAMPVLMAEGLVVQASDYVFNGFKKPGNRRGTYRFTEKLYTMLGKARKASHQREKFPMPLVLELPISRSKPKVQPNHSKHGHVVVADKNQNLLEEQKHLAEALTAQPGPGLNPGGAIAAARATSSEEATALLEAGPAFLSYLLEELKPQATKTPQALLVARLKDSRSRRDLVAAGKAWIRRREAAVATGDVTGLARDLTPDLAVSAWKVALGRMPAPNAAGYPAAYDLERSAWRACLDVAKREDPARSARIESQVTERIMAQGIQPGSLVWSRALAHGISRDLAEATPWLQEALSRSRQGAGPEWVRDRAGGRTGAAQEHRPHA